MRASAAASITGPTSLTTRRATGVWLRRDHMPSSPPIEVPTQAIASASRVREQRGQRREVRRQDVVVGIGEPFAVAATGHVGAEHAKARRAPRQGCRNRGRCGRVHARKPRRAVARRRPTRDRRRDGSRARLQTADAAFAGLKHAIARVTSLVWRGIVGEKPGPVNSGLALHAISGGNNG